MRRRLGWVWLVMVLTASTALPPAGTAHARAPSVWTVDTATKIQPTTAPGSGQAITLEGARKSYEAYQIVVTAGTGALTGVNVSGSSLSDGAGHGLPASDLTFFREAFIDFTGVTADGGTQPVPLNSPTGDGRIPDPLIPLVDPYTGQPAGAPFTVTANLNQPVWLDVYIPETAAPGVYTGTVTVTATGQPAVNLPLTLTVWDLTLPNMNAVTTWFKLSLNDLIQYHSGTWACSGQDCWLDWNARSRTIVKRYQELAHDHRIDVGEYFVPDPVSTGCKPPTDWSAYDAAMQPYMDGTYWSDGVPSGRLDVPFSPGAAWGYEADCTQAQYTALAAAWAAHLKAKGWFSRAIVYAVDEPDPSQYPAIARNSQWLQAGDRDWKAQVMDTTAPQAQYVATLNPALGIYAVALAWYDNWSQQATYGRAQWPGLFAQGIRLWFYESNAQAAPYPTYATNTLLGIEPRIMGWGTWFEGATGFLMWDTTNWDLANPWGPTTQFGKTGDGVTLYPGNHDGLSSGKAPPANGSPADVAIDGPIPSYRLKMIRAGLQDWALLTLAGRYGVTAYARAQVSAVYNQLGGCTWSGCNIPAWYWTWNDAPLEQARHNIALAIISAKASFTHFVYLPEVGR